MLQIREAQREMMRIKEQQELQLLVNTRSTGRCMQQHLWKALRGDVLYGKGEVRESEGRREQERTGEEKRGGEE